MRIGLNLLYLIPDQVGGTQIYAESLLKALAELDTKNQYFVFLNREAAKLPLPDAPNFKRVVCRVRAASRLQRYAWEQVVFPGRLRRFKLDVLHSLGYVAPLFPPCASVVTIYDINYVGMGRAMSLSRRLTLGLMVPACARRANRVITSSHSSRDDIVRHTGIAASKIDVVAGACREMPPAAGESWDEIAARYAVKEPYLVAFSSTGAHKNLARLVRAFARIAPQVPHNLVFIGRLAQGGDTSGGDIAGAVRETSLEARVTATGYVPDSHVFPLLQHADAFAFPSWYEGFGLPILEAQSAGLPIACSTAASLPEVAGEGALYFDPFSEPEMAERLRELLTDKGRREALKAQGTRNLQRFSWDKAARETLDVYERVAGA